MKNIDPANIPETEWDKLGFHEKVLLKSLAWVDKQDDRLAQNASVAEAAGIEYKPGVYDRFIGFVVNTAQDLNGAG